MAKGRKYWWLNLPTIPQKNTIAYWQLRRIKYMNMKYLLLFLLLILTTSYQLIACSCGSVDAFCQHINKEGFEEEGLICLLQPTGTCHEVYLQNPLCQHKVIEVLYGDVHEGLLDWLNANDTIWLLGGNGGDCLGFNSSITEQTFLYAGRPRLYSDFFFGYQTFSCSENFINIIDNRIIGNFFPNDQNDTLSLDVARTQLENCINDGIPNGTETLTVVDKAYHCYPNPVNTTLYIDCLNTTTAPTSLTLYDVNGRQVWSGMTNNTTIEVNTDHLPDGVYYLVEGGEQSRFIDKVLVVSN